MLLKVGRERFEVLVVCPNIVKVCPVSKGVLVGGFDIVHSVRNSLLFVLLQHLVTVVLGATKHLDNKIRRLVLEEPAKSNNTFSDCAQVIKQRRCAIRFPDVVDAVSGLVKVGHQLRVLGLGLLGLGRNKEIGALSLEGLQNGIGLLVEVSSHSTCQ